MRFSTPEQLRGDSQRRQIENARAYALKRGLELDENLTFHDLGVSAFRGRNVETGRLGEFLTAVRQGLVSRNSFLIVESLDRISRKAARKALRVLEDICEEGITVVTLSDGREYTKDTLDNDPMALMMALIIFIRANEESAMKARRLKAAWQNKRANAAKKLLTRLAPAWLRYDPAERRFHVLKDRAAVVRRIYRMTLEGAGQHAIAETLNREKVRPFGRARHWHRSYVKKVLANPAVTGTLVPHEIDYSEGKRRRKPLDPVPGYFPRVIDEETYERVRSMRIGAAAPRVRNKRREIRNLLAGLARCPINGATMTRVTKGPNGGRPALVCTTAKAGAGCQYHAVPQEQIESALIERIAELALQVPAGDETLDEKMRDLERQQEGLANATASLVGLLQSGPSKIAARELARIEAQHDKLEAQRRKLAEQIQAANGPLVRKKLADLATALSATKINRPLANALLRQVFSAVTVDWTRGQLVFQWKQGGQSEIVFAWPHEPHIQPRRSQSDLAA